MEMHIVIYSLVMKNGKMSGNSLCNITKLQLIHVILKLVGNHVMLPISTRLGCARNLRQRIML